MVSRPAAEALSQQAAVTQWPLRIALVLATLAVIAAAVWLLRIGWVRRRDRQGMMLPAVHEPTVAALRAEPGHPGKYVGTVIAGNLIDRVVAAGGVAAASVHVGAQGLLIDRQGPGAMLIPATAVTDLTTVPGMLQRRYGRQGIVLVSWLWGDREVSTGVWLTSPDDQATVLNGVRAMMGEQEEVG